MCTSEMVSFYDRVAAVFRNEELDYQEIWLNACRGNGLSMLAQTIVDCFDEKRELNNAQALEQEMSAWDNI
jgi:hypothetical protein